MLSGGCNSATAARVEIAAHYVPACAPSAQSAPAQLELIALGDFDRTNDSVLILGSDAARAGVALPEGTRAAELNTLGGEVYWGNGSLDAHNQLSILLWPRARACALARFDAAPEGGGSWLLGASDRLHALLAASSAAAPLYVDLAVASEVPLEGAFGPRQPRESASLSELGDRLVLAGGVDPTSGRTLADAELFDPALGRFDAATSELSLARSRHAALSLPGGRTLLIGGQSETGRPLGSVEVLSSDGERFSRVFELLQTPRVSPRALLLGPTRILVGGGYDFDAEGARQPINSVEFVSTDFSAVTELPIRLAPAALDRAFVSLGAGAALAVGGCELGASEPPCIPCGGGCVSRDVWWIDAQGGEHRLESLPDTLSVAQPWLVPGADGSPWLIAEGRLARFNPWTTRFEAVDAGRGAASARVLGEPVAIRPGLFAWLEENERGVELVGLFHNQRGPYAQDVAPLLAGSAQGLVPNRPPATDAELRLSYAAARGLELSGSSAVVSIADTRYAAFSVELNLVEGPPPLIKLVGGDAPDDGAAFGGLECPWPEIEAPDPTDPRSAVRLRVQRVLDEVRLERLIDGAAVEPRPQPCAAALPERVGIQLLGTRDGVTRIGRLEVRRSLE